MSGVESCAIIEPSTNSTIEWTTLCGCTTTPTRGISHRILQRERNDDDETALADALTRVYAYVYDRPEQELQEAARHRALAMRISDAWVADGCDPADPRVAAERAELVTSYTSLRRAVGPAA